MKFVSIHVIFFIYLSLLQWKPSLSVDSDCNYQEQVEIGKTYYIYNPDYPNYTNGKRNCLWQVQSPPNSKMQLYCENIDISQSPECQSDKLFISTNGQSNSNNVHKYCGNGQFSINSDSNQMIIGFEINNYGRFLCTLEAFYPSPSKCDCGWHNTRRIVGGENTLPYEFPMAVAMIEYVQLASGDIDYSVFCGGTIIGVRTIVTAAHCFYRRDLSNVFALVGDWDLSKDVDTSSPTLLRPERIIIHGAYDPKIYANDIAIFRTQKSIQYSLEIGPACLPLMYRTANFVGQPMTLIGWGSLQFGQGPSDILQKVNVTWRSWPECKQAVSDLTPTQFCTYSSGKDACQGDSGGPSLWQQSPRSRLQLLGVTSYGNGCGSKGKPGVNTNVIDYIEWIAAQTPDETYCTKL